MGSIPGQETKVLHAMHAAKKKKKDCDGGLFDIIAVII